MRTGGWEDGDSMIETQDGGVSMPRRAYLPRTVILIAVYSCVGLRRGGHGGCWQQLDCDH
jgi:hypothetical protein